MADANSIWTGKTILIAGLGESGWATLRYLAKRGAVLRLADTRAHPPGVAQLADLTPMRTCFGAFAPAMLDSVDLVVKSPGLPPDSAVCCLARERGIPVVGDVELFAQALAASGSQARIIAITGANGKSTVTALCGEMCRAAGLDTVVAGNIGLAVLDALDARSTEPDAWVLELSSFQLEDTSSLRPSAATVLNISEDHMDRYSGLTDYAAAKARIFMNGGVQVLNRDDAWCMGMRRDGLPLMTFGDDAPGDDTTWGLVERAGETWLAQGDETLLPLSAMRIAGRHNAANALAALALCRAIGLPMTPLLAALRDFAGLPHRVQHVGRVGQVDYYDDSKGTNVGATIAAVTGMGRPSVLILGGDGKGQDFSPLRAAVEADARAVVLIGRDAPQIAAVLAGSSVPVVQEVTLDDAVARATALARPGDAVLLSPACASWDMFRNYEHRAEVFVAAVRRLEEGK